MTNEVLEKLFPGGKVKDFFPYWHDAIAFAQLNTPERLAMFLAQVGHECANFTRLVENLNYNAQGLANTWPGRYALNPKATKKVPNPLAYALERKPVQIANLTYGNRYENGGVESGDGWKYRGRGTIMTTFKINYKRFDAVFDLKGEAVENPDLLLIPKWALMSGSLYWKDKKLNVFADKKDISGARKVINGGVIGLKEVKELYNKCLIL